MIDKREVLGQSVNGKPTDSKPVIRGSIPRCPARRYYNIMHKIILRGLKKYLFCKWFHDQYKCFPEVWGRGLKGPWHCDKCHPCDEDFKDFLKTS